MADYFDDQLGTEPRELLQNHLAQCSHCSDELAGLIQARNRLNSWQDEYVPSWDRGKFYFEAKKKIPWGFAPGFWLQWGPVMASVVLVVAVAFNVEISKTSGGFAVAFGGNSSNGNSEYINQQLMEFEQRQMDAQREEFQSYIARLEERQDNNNIRLMQAVLEQTQQNTTQTVEQIYTYFEEQRQLDRRSMELDYQILADSDFQIERSMQSMLEFVNFIEPR